MTAIGRKRTLELVDFGAFERPLWRKADISGWVSEIGLTNDRFTLGSGHSARIGERSANDPKQTSNATDHFPVFSAGSRLGTSRYG